MNETNGSPAMPLLLHPTPPPTSGDLALGILGIPSQNKELDFQATLQNGTKWFIFKPHYKTGPGSSVSSHITRQDQAVQFQATLQDRTRQFSFKPHYKTGPCGNVSHYKTDSHITKQDQAVQFQATLHDHVVQF